MREAISGIIGIVCGITCYSMFKSVEMFENTWTLEIVSFVVFILTFVISWFAIKYLENKG
jgi:hypothetical protein